MHKSILIYHQGTTLRATIEQMPLEALEVGMDSFFLINTNTAYLNPHDYRSVSRDGNAPALIQKLKRINSAQLNMVKSLYALGYPKEEIQQAAVELCELRSSLATYTGSTLDVEGLILALQYPHLKKHPQN
jgi:hypothetical protein